MTGSARRSRAHDRERHSAAGQHPQPRPRSTKQRLAPARRLRATGYVAQPARPSQEARRAEPEVNHAQVPRAVVDPGRPPPSVLQAAGEPLRPGVAGHPCRNSTQAPLFMENGQEKRAPRATHQPPGAVTGMFFTPSASPPVRPRQPADPEGGRLESRDEPHSDSDRDPAHQPR